jgi:hypothetical protein
MSEACGTTGETLNACRISDENPEGLRKGEGLGVDCKILLK